MEDGGKSMNTRISAIQRITALSQLTNRDFESFLRFGEKAIPEEKRAQSVGTDSAGGYLVAQEFSDRVYSMLKVVDPLFDPEVVTIVTTTTGGPFAIPLLNDTSTAATIVPENTTSTISDLVFDRILLGKAPTWRTPLVKVSFELAQDSAFDIQELLADAFAVQLQRGIGASLVSTILSGAGLGVTAAPTAITADNIHDLYASVDPVYLSSRKVGWLMTHSTLVAIRKLAGTGGEKILAAVRDDEGHPLLLDIPVFISPSMPGIATTNKSVLLGDLGSLIVRQVANSVRVRRLAERYADELAYGFLAYIRNECGCGQSSRRRCACQVSTAWVGGSKSLAARPERALPSLARASDHENRGILNEIRPTT
jgi:HK97 family phage major capsid protein